MNVCAMREFIPFRLTRTPATRDSVCVYLVSSSNVTRAAAAAVNYRRMYLVHTFTWSDTDTDTHTDAHTTCTHTLAKMRLHSRNYRCYRRTCSVINQQCCCWWCWWAGASTAVLWHCGLYMPSYSGRRWMWPHRQIHKTMFSIAHRQRVYPGHPGHQEHRILFMCLVVSN